MKIGVIKELKDKEKRVALTPPGARQLIADGHKVVLEKDAGIGSGYSNAEYEQYGAVIVNDPAEAWDSDLVIKVKEPLEKSYPYLKDNFLFTYLHLSGVTPTLTDALLKANTTAIAYETVEDENGHFPLLTPMSAVAGNMAAIIGAYYLARSNGGKGILLGNIFEDRHGKVMVIGDGVVGQHAAMTADGMGAHVYLFGLNRKQYDQLRPIVSSDIQFVESTPANIAQHITNTDLLVGAVYLAGAKAAHLVTEQMVKTMQPGSVIVDVAIDQGGCIETSRPTTHSDPVFNKHGVIHYCVTNMPGAYPRTSTIALTNATLPYILKLANEGIDALKQDEFFARGVNTCKGHITCKPVADTLKLDHLYKDFADV